MSKSLENVLSVNPYKDTHFSCISNLLKEEASPKFSKNQFVISYLNTREFINTQIEISKNIPDEDLYDAINSMTYDDLALDQTIEYKIQFIETFININEKNRYFHVFIVDPIAINETFHAQVKKLKYLDIIIPIPLLFKSLYFKEIIDSYATHCFIYLQENDACITVYHNKEFVYTKSIRYSFTDMHERFCELYGEKIDYIDFISFLSQESLQDTSSDYKKFFSQLFKEFFTNINDILMYVKRAYDVNKYEHLYIGSQIQTLTKFHKMIELELQIKSSELKFDYGFTTENKNYKDELHALMNVYLSLNPTDRYQCNFSLYKPPLAFIKRESGKLIILSAATFVFAFSYPIIYWILTYMYTFEDDLLQQKYNSLHVAKTTRESAIKNKIADKKKAIAFLTQEQQEYIEKKNTLIKIHEIKVQYPMKADLLTTLTKNLNNYDVHVEKINYTELDNKKLFTLSLIATKDRKITQLIEFMIKNYESKFKFELQNINYSNEYKKYFSELKMIIL